MFCAILLALGSSYVERRGPDYGIYCALGKVAGVEITCPAPKLNGGWPAPFLFDREGISVEWRLGFIEDEVRGGPFLADLAFYLLILMGVGAAARTIRARSRSV